MIHHVKYTNIILWRKERSYILSFQHDLPTQASIQSDAKIVASNAASVLDIRLACPCSAQGRPWCLHHPIADVIQTKRTLSLQWFSRGSSRRVAPLRLSPYPSQFGWHSKEALLRARVRTAIKRLSLIRVALTKRPEMLCLVPWRGIISVSLKCWGPGYFKQHWCAFRSDTAELKALLNGIGGKNLYQFRWDILWAVADKRVKRFISRAYMPYTKCVHTHIHTHTHTCIAYIRARNLQQWAAAESHSETSHNYSFRQVGFSNELYDCFHWPRYGTQWQLIELDSLAMGEG